LNMLATNMLATNPTGKHAKGPDLKIGAFHTVRERGVEPRGRLRSGGGGTHCQGGLTRGIASQ